MAQDNSSSSTRVLLMVLIVALIAFAGGFMVGNWNVSKSGDSADSAAVGAAAAPSDGVVADTSGSKIPLEDSPILGNANAPITVVAFSDFQCPFCKRGADTATDLQKKYPNDVKIVFKHYPLPMHQQAPAASHAAIAAGKQGKFWEMHDWLFSKQGEIGRHGDDMKQWAGGHAKELGLDIAQFEKDFDDPATKKVVDRDMELGGKVAVRGTPHFFVNGERVVGAQPITKFEEIMKKQLEEVKELQQAGVARADIYNKMVEKHFDGGAPEADKPSAPPAPSVNFVPVEKNDPVFGNTKDPLVTIVEFSDFQCPFCSRVVPTVDQIRKEYGDQVRFVFKQLPLAMHAQAKEAAWASLAAHKQGKFWEMHDLLFEKQSEYRSHANDFEAFAVSLAEKLGLNAAKFKEDYKSKAIRDQADRDLKLADEVGARGTPNFWINGVNMAGAMPFPSFKSVIDEQITKAKKLKDDKKLSGDALYKAAVEANKADAPKPAAPEAAAEKPADKVDLKDLELGKAPTKGANNAPVTIVAFSEFECPFCKRGDQNLAEALKKFDGKAKVAFKHFPLGFHQAAVPAAKAALAAGEQGKFWEMHDLLFENQSQLKTEGLYTKLAEQLGLNMDKFNKDLENPEFQKIIDQDMAQGSKVGVRGTPAYFINGTRMTGAQPPASFEAAIQKALDEAK